MEKHGNFFISVIKPSLLQGQIKISLTKRLLITGCLFLFAFVLTAIAPPEKELYSIRKGSIRFSSVAPMETIRGTSEQLKGLINAVNRTFAFTVYNHTIKGFNSQLQQEHFYENYIEADRYPKSFFEGKIIEHVDFSKDGEYTIRAKGIMNIHGVPRERIIKSTLQIRNGIIFIKARFTILLEDHAIKIPRIVFQKIANEITIDVEAELR
jgi:hypothetical protein